MVYIVCLSILVVVSCDSDEEIKDDTIKIGGIFPITSEGLAVWSQSVIYGAQLAVDEINEKGLVLGKEIELIVGDGAGVSETAVSVCKDLIAQGCVGIIGPVSSTRTIAVAEEVCIPQKIPLISPSATSSLITDLIDYNMIWRTAPSDAFQGEAAANYAYNNLNKRTAAILYVKGAYGEGLANKFEDRFESLGGSVIKSVGFDDLNNYEDYSFKEVVELLFIDSPELIYLVTFVNSGTIVATTIEANIDLSYSPVFLGCDGNYHADFLPPNSPSSVVEGMVGFISASPTNNPNNIKFGENYKTRYGVEPSAAAAMNIYDAVYLLVYAMLEAGSTDGTDIVSQLGKVSAYGSIININEFDLASTKIAASEDIDYNGASGDVDMDKNGDVTSGTYIIWKIENSVFVQDSIISYPN